MTDTAVSLDRLTLWTVAKGVDRRDLPSTGPSEHLTRRRAFGFVGRSALTGTGLASFMFEPVPQGSGESWSVHARYAPALDGPFGAPIAAMEAAVSPSLREDGEDFRLIGAVTYTLVTGQTISAPDLTITGGGLPGGGPYVFQCADTADQSWYQLVIYN